MGRYMLSLNGLSVLLMPQGRGPHFRYKHEQLLPQLRVCLEYTADVENGTGFMVCSQDQGERTRYLRISGTM